jgi:GNAT superfamily N-acetyltransferase
MTLPGSEQEVTIRRAAAPDVSTIRELMLAMLIDSPEAFGETLAEAQAQSEADWRQQVEQVLLSGHHVGFIALDRDGACGFVAGDTANPQVPPGTALVGRLWVAPRQRGTGLGRRLMEAVTKWAREEGAQQIGLGVTEMNLNAMKFYEHLGYLDLGMRFPLPWDPARQIIVLGRRLT